MPGLIGVDVGGTFTDVVVVDDDGMFELKVATTEDQSLAVTGAVAGRRARAFLHGTTAATNTLLEERGARVALLVDPDFEDIIEIARQDRPSLYDSSVDRPQPLVPRHLRVTRPEDLPEADIVAIALLDSYRDDSRERMLAEQVTLPSVLSSVISPEFREYERLATTVLSAYLTPSVAGYLRALDLGLDITNKLVMTSSGGLVPFEEAAEVAGRLVLSGPAGGVVAAAALGRHHGCDSVISFDMGGTSTDVCRITGGVPAVGTGHRVAGRVNRVPAVPIRTIGAGGGSIGWVDEGGALRVGPRSAGAVPGPACYGLGGAEFTVTDANLLAGHIPFHLALGGSIVLDVDAAHRAAGRLADGARLSPERVINGVLEVVDAHMVRALRSVSIEEGADPRQSALVAFGGAGGLHASRLARRLGITRVLVPPHSGVFSALGLLLATPRADLARTVMMDDADPRLTGAFAEASEGASHRYQSMFGESATVVETRAEMRYVGQSHELDVPGDADWLELGRRFHRLHRERFGFDRPGEPIELVNVRGIATGIPPITWGDLPALSADLDPSGENGVWQRASLPVGFVVDGPAVIIEANSATLLESGDRLTVLGDGTLEIAT